jgi:N-acetylglutamate synthase-like GNAT family acetyltransferase
MTIRRALPEEAAMLAQIALDAQHYWGYPEHWIKHSESDRAISQDFVRDNEVYVAEQDGEIRGFYALGGDNCELEHLWVTPASFGTGVGKELFLDLSDRISGFTRHSVNPVNPVKGSDCPAS